MEITAFWDNGAILFWENGTILFWEIGADLKLVQACKIWANGQPTSEVGATIDGLAQSVCARAQ